MKVTADHSRKRRGEWLQREEGGGRTHGYKIHTGKE